MKQFLKKRKKFMEIYSTNTPWGEGFEIKVYIGGDEKYCTLIRDKETGEWKALGDPTACKLLADNLGKIGMSFQEKVKEAEEY